MSHWIDLVDYMNGAKYGMSSWGWWGCVIIALLGLPLVLAAVGFVLWVLLSFLNVDMGGFSAIFWIFVGFLAILFIVFFIIGMDETVPGKRK